MNLTPLELTQKFHFARFAPDGVLELTFDHHMLSTYRMCPAKFMLDFIELGSGLRGKDREAFRVWSLEFGEWFHYCLEWYYAQWKLHGEAPALQSFIDIGVSLWTKMDMDYYSPERDVAPERFQKNYKALGGKEGILTLLIGYYAFYKNQNYKVIATEVAFGPGREVFLGEFHSGMEPLGFGEMSQLWNGRIRCYLSGRIDLLVDNGYKIGPVDHKSTAYFDGSEGDDYDPHEGILGYICAIDSILKSNFLEIPEPRRLCNTGWIFHVSLRASDTPRFKHTPIGKTREQIQSYRERQVSTIQSIFETLCCGRTPYYNTSICNNMYHRSCEYKILHRNPESQTESLVSQFFEPRRSQWNPSITLGNAQEKKQELVQLIEAAK